MNPVLALARPEILTLQPYAHAAWLPSLTRLHANEAPWRPTGDTSSAGLNRYPEPQPRALIASLAKFYEVAEECVLATRGADEAIDVLSRIFLRAGQDSILQCSPTFGMYQVAARIQGAQVIEVALDAARDWSLDAERIVAAWRPSVNLVYVCSPNNPTGNSFDATAIEFICTRLDGKAIVVVDEAYVEWARRPSLTSWLKRFPGLVILRTMSKAFALAGARLGALLGAPDVIALAKRVIPPYALTQPTIEAGLLALQPHAVSASRARIERLLVERERLRRGLEASPLVSKVWRSDANFLMIDCTDADRFMQASMAAGLIVRDLRGYPVLPNSLRVSMGTEAQNDTLLNAVCTV